MEHVHTMDTKQVIKFRAWKPDKKEMLPPIKIDELIVSGQRMSQYYDDEVVLPDNLIFMQYTGLEDKTGQEVYDGDILRLEDENNMFNSIRVRVVFRRGYFGVTADDTVYEPLFLHNAKSQVIGNIHRNPKLIGVKNG